VTRRAVITGLARNCAPYLPSVLANLARLAGAYDDVHFLFAVSDSQDASLSLLEDWLAVGRRGEVLDFGVLDERLPRRTERIAWLRNACLDRLRLLPQAEWDHLVVVDLDDVFAAQMAAPVIQEPFTRAIDWLDAAPSRAAVFANAAPRYYDVWALRHPRWCPYDCWHRIWGRASDETFEAAKFREVFRRQIEIPADMPPIAVRSAFGGLGVYRLSRALEAGYCGLDTAGREVSEHVAFNEAIASKGGELHIFPALQVRAPAQHLYQPQDFKLPWRLRMRALQLAALLRPPARQLLGPA
jgi:hypothetical protein